MEDNICIVLENASRGQTTANELERANLVVKQQLLQHLLLF